MKTQVVSLYDARKDKKLMRVLYALTLRGFSTMRFYLQCICDEFDKDYPIILVKSKSKVVGWALIVADKDNYYAHFYVSRAFRRKGIGTILYNKAKKLCGERIFCSAWDRVSAKFFEKNKANLYGELWRDTTSLNPMDIYLS